MRFFKVFIASFLAITLSACAGNDTLETQPVTMVVPMGATALSMLGLYGDENVRIDTVDGSDTLAAEFSKKDGYDAIVAPINLGAKLISNGKSEYVLDRVVTWGNLYIVGTDESALTSQGVFAAFGEGAVPQKVLTSSMDVSSITPTITYFNSVNDVQAQLLTGKASVGMLAEPAATATIAKAKENGIELNILKDLQVSYKEANKADTTGYPQAALFVKKGKEDILSSYLETATTFANKTSKKDGAIVKAIEVATVEKLGVPSAEMAQKTWARQNIKFVKASEAKKDISAFLKHFDVTLKKEHYSK